MNYPSGDKYDGGWVDGMKFGQGTFLFINGTHHPINEYGVHSNVLF
jgi:hypothetical protein